MTRPNVLLVVLDSVRARNTSLHGHVNDTTPFLAELAADRGTAYTQARAPGVWSLPSHASLFTGYHVAQHGFTDRTKRLRAGESVWTRLQGAGYETGLFSPNPYLTEVPTGLDAGFATVRGSQDLPYPDALNPREFVAEHGRGEFVAYLRACRRNDRPVRSALNGVYEKLAQDAPWLVPASVDGDGGARTYADLFLDWQSATDGPWAACLNFMDAHTPYEPGPEHDRWGGSGARRLQSEMDNQVWEFYGGGRPWWQLAALEALYDGAIRRMDDRLRDMVETLADRGALEETLLVVTADHGEGFGEPSLLRDGFRTVGHQGRGIEEPLLHVPLVVKRPGQTEPAVVEEVATLTRFPAAVDGSTAPGAFVPDGPVLASTYGLDDQKETVAARYCDELAPFRGTGHASYEGAGESVRKYAYWNDTAATIRVFDAATQRRESRAGRARVDDALAGLADRDVLERTDEGVSQATRRRLEDLGYA